MENTPSNILLSSPTPQFSVCKCPSFETPINYNLNTIDVDDMLNANISMNDSGVADDANENMVANPIESTAERVKREMEESEKLAWEMMQQESEEAYRLQMEYLRANSGQMSQDDLNLIQSLVGENSTSVARRQHGGNGDENSNVDEEEDREDDENNNDEEEEDDVDNWDYERLLELGNVLGDVKSERWKLKAKQVIATLPTQTYGEYLSEKETTTTTATENKRKRVLVVDDVDDAKCSICMDSLCEVDVIVSLPCQHFFHLNCASTWIEGHNSCPNCKQPIVRTPNK